jgi:hypothetical protein
MALPANVVTITVTGTYTDFQGNAASGTVAFTPTSSELMDPGASTMLDAVPIVATLDANGHFSVVLPCTDNTTLGPAGWNYTVTEQVHGTRSYNINLPHTLGTTVDISSLAPSTGV